MIRYIYFILLLGSSQLTGQNYLFEINDFKAYESDLSLIGQAELFQDRVRITPAAQGQVGACWYSKEKIFMNDGFETEFTFLVTDTDEKYNGGDGFAFVMQNQGVNVIGGGGDNIGYKEIPYVLVIEFDIKDDNEGSRNHINLSFYDEAKRAYRRYATVHEIPEITDGEAHFTKIIYQDGFLRVYLDSYLFPVLSVKINIAEKILSPDGMAWLGFTSATSSAFANHDLLQWNLKQYLPAPELEVEDLVVNKKGRFEVKNRNLRIYVWDHNTVDGDIVSLKWGDEWLLTEYELTSEKFEVKTTLHGFSQELVLIANNTGQIPPNTVTIAIFDGLTTQRVMLESDLKSTESIIISYAGEME